MQIKTRVAGVLAATTAAVALIGAPAFADSGPNVGNVTGIANLSVLSGNNVDTPVNVPVNVCGVAVSLLGFSNADCQGGAAVINDSGNTSNDFDFGGY